MQKRWFTNLILSDLVYLTNTTLLKPPTNPTTQNTHTNIRPKFFNLLEIRFFYVYYWKTGQTYNPTVKQAVFIAYWETGRLYTTADLVQIWSDNIAYYLWPKAFD